ncbi:TolC family protein [Cyclobacteriaceae bacterium]|jgi:outer membrane protein|nr:TolC family protein [Cyclobacteriaceae bacterium]MDC1331431.1 TolC family protein [bacterium]|tara:strand:+ start:1771 stop:3237 length:1467 start_codon:yes stop_codon:yes gene_type:complete
MRRIYIPLFSFLTFLLCHSIFGQVELRLFNLQECIDIALENNLTVKRSVLDAERSKISVQETKASRLPNLNLGANYGNNWGRSIDPTTNSFIAQQINTSGLSGNSSLNLFTGGQIHFSIKQSQLNLSAAQYDLASTKDNIAMNIANFYLNVIFNKELLENAYLQLTSTQQQLNRTQRLVTAGSLPRTSELALISQLAGDEVTLINAQNSLALAILSLKQAMLIPASERIDIVIPDIDVERLITENQTIQEIYDNAIGVRPEIKSAYLRVESANVGLKISKGAYYPSLRMNGNLFTNYSDIADRQRILYDNTVSVIKEVPIGYYIDGTMAEVPVFSRVTTGTIIGEESFNRSRQWRENFSQSLSFNLSVPVFNNLRTNANVQRAKIQLEQSEIIVKEQTNQLRQTIESAFNDTQSSKKSFFASKKQVEALEETLRIIESQYNLGAANFTEYQIASNNLFAAKSDLARSKFNYIFKQKILDFYQNRPLTF